VKNATGNATAEVKNSTGNATTAAKNKTEEKSDNKVVKSLS